MADVALGPRGRARRAVELAGELDRGGERRDDNLRRRVAAVAVVDAERGRVDVVVELARRERLGHAREEEPRARADRRRRGRRARVGERAREQG